VLADHGKVDILVLCAGVIARTPLAQSTDEEWNSMLSVNVLGVVNPTRKLFPIMCERGFGKILACGSIAAKNGGVASGPAYVASKAAVHGMMRWIAKAGAPHGVYANTLAPGPVETAMWASVTSNQAPAANATVPLGRYGNAEDIAQAALVSVFSRFQLDHRHVAGYQRRHVDGLKREPHHVREKVPVIGFVGLGVMGGPMCRNVALKHSGEVIAFDS
jgi:NAD(P)-dependent dehydrogenase (short-subunit alcohol dehydrogenase family)